MLLREKSLSAVRIITKNIVGKIEKPLMIKYVAV
jgi:hypothetical protein